MSERPTPFNRAPNVAVRGLFMVSAATVVLLVMVAGSPVLGSDDELPGASRSVSLNQSVALDELEESPAISVRAPSAPRPAPSDNTDGEVLSGAPSTPPRRIERRGAAEAGAEPLGERDTPWYRTGIGALGVVLVLVGGIYYLVRRWMPASRLADGSTMRVVARTSLSPKHHAALVQLGRRFVMVAVSPNGAETLCEITDPDEVAELIGRTAGQTAPARAGFDDQLARELAEYREDLEDETGAARVTRSSRRLGREPLTDLLHRLRALRTK